MSRSLAEIQRDLKNPELEPGSEKETQLHQEARDVLKSDTDEYETVHVSALHEVKDSGQLFMPPEQARHMAHAAIEQVTGEYQIPVNVFDQEKH